MRRLWECKDWSRYVSSDCRTGIRLRFDKNVDPEVKRACKEYVCWLREYYEFPMRVPIYFKEAPYVKMSTGERCSALFFGPYDKSVEPYIKVSTGDYSELLENWGKDDALAAMLHSITHELSHYYQWLKDMEINSEKDERQALYYATVIVRDYAQTREHP